MPDQPQAVGDLPGRPVIALTGATGYVGGLLLGPLSRMSGELRCLTRRPESLAGVLPDPARAMKADLVTGEGLEEALRGADIAFYLVHSLDERGDFSKLEERSAENFARAAGLGGARRIVYLGALGSAPEGEASDHIESRGNVGGILRRSGASVIELRSPMVIGPGSCRSR